MLRLVPIVVVAALAATAPPVNIGHSYPKTEQQAEPNQRRQQANAEAKEAPGESPTSRLYVQAACEHGCGYSEDNKGMWEKIVTDPVAAFTGVLAFLTFGLIIVGGIQSRLIFQQIRLARKEFESKQRPWVFVRCTPDSSLEIPEISASNRRALFKVGIAFKNVGATPALNIWYEIQMVEGDRTEQAALQNTMSHRLDKKIRQNNADFGFSLFPDQTLMESCDVACSVRKIPDGLTDAEKSSMEFFQPHIVGVVVYKSPTGGVGLTKFSYILAKSEPSDMIIGGVGNAIQRDDRHIPKSTVIMKQAAVGSAAS